MTETPIADDAQAAQHPELSLWEKIHADSVHGWQIFSRMFPIMEKIAADPSLRALFTEAMIAADAGVPAHKFESAIDLLGAARKREQAAARQQASAPALSGPQPQFTPAADGATAQLPVAPGAA
jgi:hypothetical protein